MSEHKEDLLTDMLRFFPQFGTDPFEVMDGPVLFVLATRMAAYGGVMAYRLAEVAQPTVAGAVAPAGSDVVPLAAFRAQHPGLVEAVSTGG